MLPKTKSRCRPRTLAVPRLVARGREKFEEALARDVEADAGMEEVLVAVLHVVVPVLREVERMDALQPATTWDRSSLR